LPQDGTFVSREKRSFMMGHELLAIVIAAPIVWGSRWRLWFSTGNPCAKNSDGKRLLSTSRRSLLMVLDEEILVELVLWTWVVFVLWATRPNYYG
jgi:hypothetical protein